MKIKSFFAAAAVAVMASCGTPYQATDSGTVIVASNEAQTAFIQQYPNSTNVVWSNYDPNVVIINDWELAGWSVIDPSDYVARFDMDGETYYAWYDTDGTWVGTAYVVRDHATMPASIHNTIKTTYSDYTIDKINREFHKDRNLYEVTLKSDTEKGVLLVDNDGNIVKSKVKPK